MTKKQFKQARLTLGLTQQELADKLKIKHFQSISRIERGERKASARTLELLKILLQNAKR
jgi:transcriptional regulator with XRE-family HTH domain